MQAQPNKIKLEARDEQKYKDKLLLKAKVICDSANRLWREFLSFPFFPKPSSFLFHLGCEGTGLI